MPRLLESVRGAPLMGHPIHMTPSLPLETLERRCPACQSEKIVHAGYVVGGGGLIRSEQRCEACGTEFWLVRTRDPGIPPPP